MKIFISLLWLFAAQVVSATTLTDASLINTLKPGIATPEKVKITLGEPSNINKSPDGRFIYFYDFEFANIKDPPQPTTTGVVAFLFDKNSKLIKSKFYAKDK